jgi:16S rRNA (adenine(1408)-N(1))-methyltransferase
MQPNSPHSSPPTQGVILDIGTGDGRFVYQMARQNPHRLYIGIDASSEALVKVSEKIYRNPKHGGAKNAMFIQARVEQLPEELNSVADEVHIHFPWGSLLGALLKPDAEVLKGIRRVCKQGTLVEIITSIDESRDLNELNRVGISAVIDDCYVEEKLRGSYAEAGLYVTEHGVIPPQEWPRLCTSWAAKLKAGGSRTVRYLIAEAR